MTHTAPQPADQPVFKNAAYTQEYIDIAESLDGDIPGRRAARAYMDSSTAIVHHRVVSTSFVPKLYDAASRRVMREVVETTHRILCKVMQHYLDDAEYRKIFDYDPRLAELILVPRGYDALLPFARFDIFLDENTGDVAFCEFNGDGSSGMNENREITHSVEGTATFKEFARRHHVEGCELFDAWVREFAAIYATYEHRVENPRFAICDYLQNGVVSIFDEAAYNSRTGEFEELRSYLFSKLMWNPDMTREEYERHMNEFLQYYYGDGWEYIRRYIDATYTEIAGVAHFNHAANAETVYPVKKSDDSFAFLSAMYGLFEKAEAAATTPEEATRIRKSSVQALYLWLYRMDRSAPEDMKEKLAALIKEAHIAMSSEGRVVPAKLPVRKPVRLW